MIATQPQMHWAAPLIGKPHSDGGQGPDSFSCWGLVRWSFRVRHGIELPAIAVGEDENAVAIKRSASASGWRPAAFPALEDDVVMMRGTAGRHVGMMVRANGRLGLLHSQHGLGVAFQPLDDVLADGYGDHELWRFAGDAK